MDEVIINIDKFPFVIKIPFRGQWLETDSDYDDEDTERYLSLHFSFTETLDYNTFLSQISDKISYNKTPLLSNLRRAIKAIYSKAIHK